MNEMYTILLIDDKKEFHEQLRFPMGESFVFVSAYSTKQAMKLIKKEKFDLILVDLEMSEEDVEKEGYDLMSLIKLMDNGTPYIVVTNSNESSDATKSLKESGAYWYFYKGEYNPIKWELKFIEAIKDQKKTILENKDSSSQTGSSSEKKTTKTNSKQKNTVEGSTINVYGGSAHIGDSNTKTEKD